MGNGGDVILRDGKSLNWLSAGLLLLLAGISIGIAYGGQGFETAVLENVRPDMESVLVKGLTPLMIFITHVGDSITLITISVLVLVYLYKKVSLSTLSLVFVAYAGVFVAAPLLKNLFGRTRPDVTEHLVHVASASMPSGHALRSSVVYLLSYMILSRLVPSLRRVKVAVILLVFSIGFSRLYLGVHWPSDVIAGWVMAAVWLACSYHVLEQRPDI